MFVLAAELSIGMESRPSSFHDAAQRRGLDPSNDVRDVIEQALRKPTAPYGHSASADPQKEELVRPREGKRDGNGEKHQSADQREERG